MTHRDVAESLGRLAIAAQEVFPEAWREVRSWLPLVGHAGFLVYQLQKSGLCERYPDEALQFLDAIVSDRMSPSPTELGLCLDAIVAAEPSLQSEGSFKRMREHQRLYGT